MLEDLLQWDLDVKVIAMQLPNAVDMMWFLEISRTMNMTRAAERLGITQPALTQSMKRLEAVFNTDLLKRERTGVTLTKAGEKLRDHAGEFLNRWEDLSQAIGRQEDDVSGTYKIGLHSSLILHLADHIVAGLVAEFSQLNLILEHDISRRIVESVISQKIDFGIVVNPIEQDELVISELTHDLFTLWGTTLNKAPLETQPFIYHPDLKQTTYLLQRLPFKPRRVIESTSLEAVAHLVGRGTGIGILPERLIRFSAVPETLIKYDEWGFVSEKICLIYRSDRHANPASKAIIRAIRSIVTGLHVPA